MIRLAVLLAISFGSFGGFGGCGRFHFDSLAVGDGHVVDAAPDAFACTSFGPWSAPEQIVELETFGNDWGGQLSPDGLALYYQNGTDTHVSVARRPDRQSPFGAPVSLLELEATGLVVGDPSVTADELDLYTTATIAGHTCVYESTRATTADPWSAPAKLDALCAPFDTACAFITGDGLTLYYDNHLTAASYVLSTTRASRADAFAVGTQLPTLQTNISCPSLSRDQLDIYFDYGVTGDTWAASRPTLGSPFTSIGAPLPGADAIGSDTDSSITADGLELVFSSNRVGGAGGFDLYRMTRTCN